MNDLQWFGLVAYMIGNLVWMIYFANKLEDRVTNLGGVLSMVFLPASLSVSVADSIADGIHAVLKRLV